MRIISKNRYRAFRKTSGKFLASILILALTVPVSGMGILPGGGEITIGINLQELYLLPDRPVPALQSVLLDEIFEPVVRSGAGSPADIWSSGEAGKVLLKINSNIVIDDTDGNILDSATLLNSLGISSSQRWDAMWVLREIEGMNRGMAWPPSGMEILDENSIRITLKPGADLSSFSQSLSNPSLRFSTTQNFREFQGCGPFVVESRSPDSKMLRSALSYHSGRPYIDSFGLFTYTTTENAVLDFGRGSLDALIIESQERQLFSTSSRAASSRVEKIADAILVLFINPLRLPSAAERRSLALSVDRVGIAAVELGSGASPVSDFTGTAAMDENWSEGLEEAGALRETVGNLREILTLLVCDDPAARQVAGRIRANWASLDVPVDFVQEAGPLMLSLKADATLMAIRLPENGDGVLPECLALYDRSGWWNFAAIAMNQSGAELINNARNLDPDTDMAALGEALESSGLIIPVAKFEILFAPSPDIALVPDYIYPGTPFYRVFIGGMPSSANSGSV